MASPVARYTSTAAPIASPWLYVQTVPPLFPHDPLSPSFTSPDALISPLRVNQFQPVTARARQVVSPAIRLCRAAASRTYRPLTTAFLYVRSRFHHTPPPQVEVSQKPFT